MKGAGEVARVPGWRRSHMAEGWPHAELPGPSFSNPRKGVQPPLRSAPPGLSSRGGGCGLKIRLLRHRATELSKAVPTHSTEFHGLCACTGRRFPGRGRWRLVCALPQFGAS